MGIDFFVVRLSKDRKTIIEYIDNINIACTGSYPDKLRQIWDPFDMIMKTVGEIRAEIKLKHEELEKKGIKIGIPDLRNVHWCRGFTKINGKMEKLPDVEIDQIVRYWIFYIDLRLQEFPNDTTLIPESSPFDPRTVPKGEHKGKETPWICADDFGGEIRWHIIGKFDLVSPGTSYINYIEDCTWAAHAFKSIGDEIHSEALMRLSKTLPSWIKHQIEMQREIISLQTELDALKSKLSSYEKNHQKLSTTI